MCAGGREERDGKKYEKASSRSDSVMVEDKEEEVG